MTIIHNVPFPVVDKQNQQEYVPLDKTGFGCKGCAERTSSENPSIVKTACFTKHTGLLPLDFRRTLLALSWNTYDGNSYAKPHLQQVW